MKQRLLPVFIFSVLVVPHTTHAQFLKGIFGQKHKHTHKKEITTSEKPSEKKKQPLVYPETVRKNRYRIDIMAQLYLDDLVNDDKLAYKDKMPDKAASGVAFCQGALLAVDTLKAMGYDLDVFIHDVNTRSGFPSGLIGNKQLDTSSLIIGAVTSKDIPDLASFAGSHHINFVSALSSADGDVKDDIFFTILLPGVKQHCAFIVNEVLKKYPTDKATLFYRTNVTADNNVYHAFTAHDTVWNPRKIACNTVPCRATLDTLFDSTINNIIVVGINDANYAEQFLDTLSQNYPNYRFEVYGMPSWKGISAIHKPEAYTNIGINISAPFYFNQNSPIGKYIERSFHAKFNGHTGEMVYRGYESVFWFATLLNRYGTTFNAHLGDVTNAPFTKFSLKPQWNKDLDLLYNENEHLYLYRYQGGSYMVEQQ